MMSQAISVIIPTYNRGEFLVRALNSICKQTVPCLEIIIIDDGSYDNTKEIVDKYRCSSNVEIRYLYQNNKGPSAARNHGISIAKGEYIAFLDSDDHWNKNKIKKQYNSLVESPKLRISHTYEKWLRRGEHLNQKKIHIPREGDIFSHCLQLCAVGMSTVLIHKSIFDDYGLFDENLPCCEDYDFWLRVSSREKFNLIPEKLTIKEGGREDQVSWQYRVGMDTFRIDAIKKIIDSNVLSTEQTQMAREELVRKATIYSNGALKHGEPEKAKKYIELIKIYGNIL